MLGFSYDSLALFEVCHPAMCSSEHGTSFGSLGSVGGLGDLSSIRMYLGIRLEKVLEQGAGGDCLP